MAQATEALRITAPELLNYGVMDAIIPEPLGGAHGNPMAAFPAIKDALMNIYHSKYAALSGALGSPAYLLEAETGVG